MFPCFFHVQNVFWRLLVLIDMKCPDLRASGVKKGVALEKKRFQASRGSGARGGWRPHYVRFVFSLANVASTSFVPRANRRADTHFAALALRSTWAVKVSAWLPGLASKSSREWNGNLSKSFNFAHTGLLSAKKGFSSRPEEALIFPAQ